ncbi:uncharacterized protein PRCAT00001013001 [Priceomyces carsonii]|uniref:uncharacterized protein n=1 Tax=Priceomyces carsonii TaxID=28549 RepID=UPI002EDA4641|nr:unnamed protein product [Priceomyces carsonii]
MPKKSSHQSHQSKLASLFDVRLTNLDHDVLVLKGNETEASSALLTGNIVLSLKESISVKKISLRLYGTLRMSWTEQMGSTRGSAPRTFKFERQIFEHLWDSNDLTHHIHAYRTNESSSGNALPVGTLSKTHSTASLKSLGHASRSLSSTSLTGKASSARSSSTNLAALSSLKGDQVLTPGNYEIPFNAILPGNMPESVDGLPGGAVIYKMEATIDRGKFHNNMVTKRHLRIVRTLGSDAVELSETVAVDNTWPKKVEYSINVPSKAIAIGSGTPISFMLVPLMKGLKLGEIKLQLVEFFSFAGNYPGTHNDLRTVVEKKIKRPDENDERFQMDRWEIDAFLKVPATLSKCTQDCEVPNHLKVRHKIKVVIGLVNPDGHVSELRASLPVQLFISPFVRIIAKQESSTSLDKDAKDVNEREEVLFANDTSEGQTPNVPNTDSYTSLTGIVAPPVYERHIFDRLWNDVSPAESPIGSGSSTPRHYGNDVQDQMSLSPLDSMQLVENLRQLCVQRGEHGEQSGNMTPTMTPSSVGSRGRPTFNIDGDTHNESDYFSRPAASSRPLSPSVASPPVHMSRVNSSSSLFDPTSLSRVPSYSQAISSAPLEESLAPVYEPPRPGSKINLNEVNKRFEELSLNDASDSPQTEGKLSKGHSSANLANLSRNTSSLSPTPPRSESNVNLTPLPPSMTRGSSKWSIPSVGSNSSRGHESTHDLLDGKAQGDFDHSTLSNSPALGTSPGMSKSPEPHPHAFFKRINSSSSVTKPSSSASNRSAAINAPLRSSSSLSLHNLQFLNKKKDKK